MRKGFADRLAEAVGTGLYSGYFPLFPGTVGSVAGIVVYLVLFRLGAIGRGLSIGWPITLAVTFAVGTAAAHRCEQMFGHDSKRIVVDEIWGQLIALFLVPVTWRWILASFVLFRIFDIIKPFPGRRAERVGGGIAVMLDDGIAGAYTLIVLHLLRSVAG